ncbi:MAG: hypothetical protein H5T69_04615 [Chloroflexi bacterium]|nr:hypothetical protein [Chloroflexota bacterium]
MADDGKAQTMGDPEPEELRGQGTSIWQPLGQAWRPSMATIWPWLMVAAAGAFVVLAIYFGLQHRLFACTATVEAVEGSTLELLPDGSAAHEPLREGALLEEGVRLNAAAGTVARIRFCTGGMLRIESAGQWFLREMVRSRNGRLSRVVIEQIQGQASIVSPPLRHGQQARTVIRLPHGQVELMGVATLATSAEGRTRLWLLQGRALVLEGSKRRELAVGEEVVLE